MFEMGATEGPIGSTASLSCCWVKGLAADGRWAWTCDLHCSRSVQGRNGRPSDLSVQQRASGSCSNIKTTDAACRYTDHSFDAEFITLLRDVCIGYLRRTPEATLEEILDFVLKKVGVAAYDTRLATPAWPMLDSVPGTESSQTASACVGSGKS